MNINELTKKAHDAAVEKGFYDCECLETSVAMPGIGQTNKKCKKCNGTGKQKRNIPELLMLIVSELSEAMEAHRGNTAPIWELYQQEIDDGYSHERAFKNHIKDTFEDEIADAFIRLADLCGYLGIDIERHIEAKMEYNKSREYKHGKEY